MHDRIDSIGGSVVVMSRVGEGSRIGGILPIAAHIPAQPAGGG
jgi:chemotaxis protein histidine kinase CheA